LCVCAQVNLIWVCANIRIALTMNGKERQLPTWLKWKIKPVMISYKKNTKKKRCRAEQ